MLMSHEATRIEEGLNSPCTGFAADVLPAVPLPQSAENLKRGVSTRNAPNSTSTCELPHWYALRTTYGQEKKAYDYIVNHQGVAFYPTVTVTKRIKGKRKTVTESRLPNIFFAYGTFDDIKQFVYDNVNLPFLRFYYRYFLSGSHRNKEPLIVPERQMKSLKIICEAENDDIIVSTSDIPKFQVGQLVRITNGGFAGVEGRVARFQGQQRVAVRIDGLLTIVTAYIPKGFLEVVEK